MTEEKKDKNVLENMLAEVEEEMLRNNAEALRVVMKRVVNEAHRVLDDIQRECEKTVTSEQLGRKLKILRHELVYLKEMCAGPG